MSQNRMARCTWLSSITRFKEVISDSLPVHQYWTQHLQVRTKMKLTKLKHCVYTCRNIMLKPNYFYGQYYSSIMKKRIVYKFEEMFISYSMCFIMHNKYTQVIQFFCKSLAQNVFHSQFPTNGHILIYLHKYLSKCATKFKCETSNGLSGTKSLLLPHSQRSIILYRTSYSVHNHFFDHIIIICIYIQICDVTVLRFTKIIYLNDFVSKL